MTPEPVVKPSRAPRAARRSSGKGGREEKPARGRWIRAFFLWAVVAVSLFLAAGVAGTVWISRTAAGRELALDWALARVRPAINGSITVGSVGPGGILGGATLYELRLEDSTGHRVLATDSVRARYSVAGMLGSLPGISDLEVWGAVVDLAPSGGRVDLGSLVVFRDGAEAEGAPPPGPDTLPSSGPHAPPPAFRIGNMRIRDGSLILNDADGTQKRVAGIEADFPRVDIRPGSGVFLAAFADDVALSYPAGDGVLDLSGITGEVEIGPEGVLIDAARFRLPASEGEGRMEARWMEARSDGGRLHTTFDLDMTRLALADLSWIDERFDHGVARGRVGIVGGPAGPRIEFDRMEADFGAGGRITLTGSFLPGDAGGPRQLRAEPERFATEELERYLPEALPVTGFLSGDLLFDGAAGVLGVAGELTLLAATGLDTLVHLSGSGTTLGSEGVADVAVTATTLDYALLDMFVSQAEWRGHGNMTIRADGALETGITVEIAADQSLPGGSSSSVAFAGSVYGDTAISVVDLAGTVSPLSLSALGELFPAFRSTGSVRGSFSLRGAMDRLNVAVDLETDAGPLTAEGMINARNLAAGYNITASSDGLNLSRLIARLPDSTIVAGRAMLNGRGLDRESLRGNLALDAGPSTIGPLRVDSAELDAWVDAEGLLHVETVYAAAGGTAVRGRGSLGVASDAAGNGVVLSVSSPSIRPLRDIFMGPNLVAWDELPPIEQDLLIAVDGADPDTFPRAGDIRFDGRVDGEVVFTGALDDLSAAAAVDFAGLEYGHVTAGSLGVDLGVTGMSLADPGTSAGGVTAVQDRRSAADSPSSSRVVIRGTVTGDSLTYRDREFQRVALEGDLALGDRGRLRALVRRAEDESYEAQAVVQLDEQGGRVDLDRLTLAFDDERRWNLQGPARFDWGPDAVEVRDFGLIRPGFGGLSLRAHGRLSRGRSDSDFQLRADRLDLQVLGRLLQMDAPPTGILAATLDATGSGDDPEWKGMIRVDRAEYQTLLFDSVSVRGSYADRTLETEFESWTNHRRTIQVEGIVPLDLRLASVADRVPDRPVDLAVAADSFPARMVLGALKSLEEVDGTITGDVTLGGLPSDMAPDGELRLEDFSALVAPLGVRLSAVAADVGLSPHGVVRVTGAGVSGDGTAEVEGTVDLGQLADSVPLNLAFRTDRFQIVDRADMKAAVSSESITLTGSYEFPYIEGTVEVEGGTVFMEEFQRTAEVVDLYDPALFSAATVQIGSDDDDEAGGERIPFLQNLRVLIDMRVGRGNFLRSRQMNVETTGDLTLTFDRRGNQLILQGEMEVARGTYSLGPRPLTLTEGVFRFPGTPGFNPGIAVTAETRLRTREGQPLVITADISGTLLSPVPSFSSDAESAMSEADLINYLFLGRPTSALIGEAGASVGAGRDLLLGRFANEISYLVATGLGVDHISVSRSEGQASAAFGASSLQLEVGKYVLDDVFLTGVFQRGFCTDPTLPRNSGGLRIEMGMPRDVRLQGFMEGRCTRERYRGLGDASLALENIWGFLLFREWGY